MNSIFNKELSRQGVGDDRDVILSLFSLDSLIYNILRHWDCFKSMIENSSSGQGFVRVDFLFEVVVKH